MRWFGEPWGALALVKGERVDVPVGQQCFHCEHRIEEGDRGFVLPHYGAVDVDWSYIHKDCMSEHVLGPDWREIMEGVKP